MTGTLTVTSWNMAHTNRTWDLLSELGTDVVLVQEGTKRGSELSGSFMRVVAPPSEDWLIANSGAYATAIVAMESVPDFQVVPVSAHNASDGAVVKSQRPGQYTIISVPFGNTKLFLVSLYAVWDDNGKFADVSLHDALTEIAPLLGGGAEMLVMGDLNVFRDHTLGDGPATLRRYQAVFERFESLGLGLLGPFGTEPLVNCPCADEVGCSHVRTLRWMKKPDSTPLQLDFAFGTQGVQSALTSCKVIDDERFWEASDHAPIQVILQS